MKTLIDNAKNRLDNYLSQVKTSLQSCTSVDADEVQRDITEHIETELEGMAEPVSLEELETVLTRLGSPTQWVPEEEISWWRKIILRLRTGPEDWRLAYITFGFFVLWLLSLHSAGPHGIPGYLILGPFAILQGSAAGLLLLLSFIVARATISVAGSAKELGGQKWLIYPSLLSVYVPLVVFMIIWPIGPVVIMAEETTRNTTHLNQFLHSISRHPSPQFYTFWISAGLAAVGLWWIILGAFCCIRPRLVRAIFRPFADGFKRKWAAVIIVVGIMLVVLCGFLALIFNSHIPTQINIVPMEQSPS